MTLIEHLSISLAFLWSRSLTLYAAADMVLAQAYLVGISSDGSEASLEYT
jgi:hypothetical protein